MHDGCDAWEEGWCRVSDCSLTLSSFLRGIGAGGWGAWAAAPGGAGPARRTSAKPSSWRAPRARVAPRRTRTAGAGAVRAARRRRRAAAARPQGCGGAAPGGIAAGLAWGRLRRGGGRGCGVFLARRVPCAVEVPLLGFLVVKLVIHYGLVVKLNRTPSTTHARRRGCRGGFQCRKAATFGGPRRPLPRPQPRIRCGRPRVTWRAHATV